MPRRARASSEVLVHLSYQTTLRLQMQRSSVSDFPWLRLMPLLQHWWMLVPQSATQRLQRRS